jgi:hypothetical protein
MQNGTLPFYSAVASLIPLAFVTYIITLRDFPAAYGMLRTIWREGWVTPESGCAMTFLTFTPFVALAIGVTGEVFCLNTLFTGHPTHNNAVWTIAALITMAVAMLTHPLILSLQHLKPKDAGTNVVSHKDPPQTKQDED